VTDPIYDGKSGPRDAARDQLRTSAYRVKFAGNNERRGSDLTEAAM
jgi:hypothetical protein